VALVARGGVAVLGSGACDDGRDRNRCGDGSEGTDGSVWGDNLAVVDGTAYYTRFGAGPNGDERSVWSMPGAGGPHTCLWQGGGPHQLLGGGMAVTTDRIFWTSNQNDGSSGAVYSIPRGGGDRTEVGRFEDHRAAIAGVVATDTTIFAASLGEIMRIPIDGGHPRVLYASDTEEVGWFIVDEETIYFTTWGSGSLRRMSTGGGTPTTIAALPNLSPGRFDRDADAVCVTTSTDVLRVPLDGSPTVRIASHLDAPRSCVIASGWAYVTFGSAQSAENGIVRTRLDGTAQEIVYTTSAFLTQLAADDERLYYAGIDEIGRLAH